MKILAIRGSNLASLSGPFEIDLQQEPLASAGLFAICGATGAGKSTLLDALCLALYDATPRLLKAGSRGVDLPDVQNETVTPQDTRTLLRRGTSEGFAEVDFVGSDAQAYRARWSVRRSRNRIDGSLQKINMTLHSLPALQAIGSTMREVKAEIALRIGLNFDQFTRAVLLAQNEFSAFLKADDGERGALLETLTGSDIYSMISIRAFDREKREKAALQTIIARLTDHTPLAAETRILLDQQSNDAARALAHADSRRESLEQQLRWHHDRADFEQQEQLARTAWQAGIDASHAAAPRQAALNQIEAVQPARPLLHEADRIARELIIAQNQIGVSDAARQVAAQARQAADLASQSAAQLLQIAEQSRSEAAPLLESARALDIRIDALKPIYSDALQNSSKIESDATRAAQTLDAKSQETATAMVTQQEIGDWLKHHAHLKTLAMDWPRWDALFSQAAVFERGRAEEERKLIALRTQATDRAKNDVEAMATLGCSATALQTAIEARRLAMAELEQFDPDVISTRKRHMETRRDLLVSADTLWRALNDQQTQYRVKDAKLGLITQAIVDAERLSNEAEQGLAVGSAALAQAERSLKGAEAACGVDVETLRATLTEGEHCPVCGSIDHPYQATNPQLRAALASLTAQVAACRAQVQQAVTQRATQTATAVGLRTQHATITEELAILSAGIVEATRAWESQSLVIDAGPAATALATVISTACNDWLCDQMRGITDQLHELDRQEQAWRQATAIKAQRQTELDALQLQHAAAQTATAISQAQRAQVEAQCETSEDKCSDAARNRDIQLDALAVAFDCKTGEGNDTDADWRSAWLHNSAAFQLQQQTQAQCWLSQTQACAQGQIRLDTLQREQKGLIDALAVMRVEAHRLLDVFNKVDAACKQMQVERTNLFDGKTLNEVETAFHRSIDTAKAKVAEHIEVARRHSTNETRCIEAVAHVQQHMAQLQQAAADAHAAVEIWRTTYNARRSDTLPLDLTDLRTMLTHAADWIIDERLALQRITVSVDQATAVLRERQLQTERHIKTRPAIAAGDTNQPADSIDSADRETTSLQTALANLLVDCKTAIEDHTTLLLRIKHDDALQHRSATIVAQRAQQEQVHRRWAQLSDLIGSADGKKFRNYAQQFTLDVLLGYANRHLHDLSRRYQLQRINESLALMVVDQEMGDELRSVHSLSGGESFLVSLALALGLASLSSNRVRVESLFIDEGFGSLDADTLRVAMDALDGLQAMGRKVGVISHVQEMTERIGAKIVVQRISGGRSQVVVMNG